MPAPTILGPASVCFNSTGNVYTTETGPGIHNYIWNVTGGTITAGGTPTDNTVTVTWNTVGNESVSVNYTDINGCTAALPTVYDVVVNPLPAPTITGPSPVCVNSTGNVYTTETGSGIHNYIWSVTGGTITSGGLSTDNTVTVTWVTSGIQTVSVNYENSYGCYAATPGSKSVIVIPLPTPIISGSNNACIGSTVNYTTESGMSSYTWPVSAGGSITSGGSSTDNTVTVTWDTTGAQTVSVSCTNAFGCTSANPTVLNVTVNALPTPGISGQDLPTTGTPYVYTTESSMTNYLWTVSSGGSITAGGGTGDNTITIVWTVTGSQSVSVNYTNNNGCTAASPTVHPVIVSQSLSTISGNITYYNSANTVMNNVTVTLQGTSYSAVTNLSGYYQIQNIPAGTYTMVCTTVKPTGGINAGDAALTNQWGNSKNNNSWPAIQLVKFFSGDASGNNIIQAVDPAMILTYFVNTWEPGQDMVRIHVRTGHSGFPEQPQSTIVQPVFIHRLPFRRIRT